MTYYLTSTLKQRMVLFFTLFISLNAIAQPVAKFSSNITQGCNPTSIQFINQSTGNPTLYNWDFGDGSTSTQPFPQKTYTSSGSFTVTLIVSNNFGSDTI